MQHEGMVRLVRETGAPPIPRLEGGFDVGLLGGHLVAMSARDASVHVELRGADEWPNVRTLESDEDPVELVCPGAGEDAGREHVGPIAESVARALLMDGVAPESVPSFTPNARCRGDRQGPSEPCWIDWGEFGLVVVDRELGATEVLVGTKESHVRGTVDTESRGQLIAFLDVAAYLLQHRDRNGADELLTRAGRVIRGEPVEWSDAADRLERGAWALVGPSPSELLSKVLRLRWVAALRVLRITRGSLDGLSGDLLAFEPVPGPGGGAMYLFKGGVMLLDGPDPLHRVVVGVATRTNLTHWFARVITGNDAARVVSMLRHRELAPAEVRWIAPAVLMLQSTPSIGRAYRRHIAALPLVRTGERLHGSELDELHQYGIRVLRP